MDSIIYHLDQHYFLVSAIGIIDATKEKKKDYTLESSCI